jgi:mono/diheme cytochrome c family protein
MLTTRTSEAHEWAVKTFRGFRSDGQFVPFVAGGQQTVVFPGFDGGAEWGGPAIDPVRNILYVNANEMAWTGGLVEAGSGGSAGERLYRTQCAICHGVDRAGSPPAFPTLVDVTTRLTEAKIRENIHQGNGRMPSFPNLDDASVNELIAYLKSPAKPSGEKELPEAAKPAAEAPSGDAQGANVYSQQCGICHGDHMEGDAPAFPMLIGLGGRMNAAQVTDIIKNGKGRMPGQPDISPEDLAALLKFLGVKAQAGAEAHPASPAAGGPAEYVFTGYRKFLDPDGYPAIQPPWGTLSAIDLKTGNYLWKVNLGEYPALAAKGMADTGSENYGGPIVTAGGVVFIGATVYDHKFRAFDAATGKLLWQKELPYSGVATPATYMIDGRQYVVIAASGARTPNEPQGGVYVAFALPAR